MKRSLFLILAHLFLVGCVHQTSMQDKSLHALWKGYPIDQERFLAALEKHPDDQTLLNLQQGLAFMRVGQDSKRDFERAKNLIETATLTFDDLRQPNNFSEAFTADSATPYRGRPYERVLSSLLLGILDAQEGRCDMAIPALRSAEFLDARWQPFTYGTDAPMVYALSLRCLYQTRASQGDITRAKEGLFRSLRLLELLVPMADSIDTRVISLMDSKGPVAKIAAIILEAGLPTALMEAAQDADAANLLEKAVDDSMRFYVQVLSDKNDGFHELLMLSAKELEARFKSTDKIPSAQSLAYLRTTLNEVIANVQNSSKEMARFEQGLVRVRAYRDRVDQVAKSPKMPLLFEGVGPSMRRQGQYGEVAQVVPVNPADAKAKVTLTNRTATLDCGVSRTEKGSLLFVLCDQTQRPGAPAASEDLDALLLWSSSYQATSMVGRRFDQILKGRAQFKLGTEVAAAIGLTTALALMDIGSKMQQSCRGSGCEAGQSMQMAGAIIGVAAGGAWLAGMAVNPRADIRHVTNAFESGYLLLNQAQH